MFIGDFDNLEIKSERERNKIKLLKQRVEQGCSAPDPCHALELKKMQFNDNYCNI